MTSSQWYKFIIHTGVKFQTSNHPLSTLCTSSDWDKSWLSHAWSHWFVSPANLWVAAGDRRVRWSHDPCIAWKILPVSAIAWPMEEPSSVGCWLLWSYLSRYPVIFLGWMTLVTILTQLPWLHQLGYPAYILSPKVLGTLVTCVHWSTLSQPLLIPSWTMVNDS